MMFLMPLDFTEYIILDANHSLLIASAKELVLRTQSWFSVYSIFLHKY